MIKRGDKTVDTVWLLSCLVIWQKGCLLQGSLSVVSEEAWLFQDVFKVEL